MTMPYTTSRQKRGPIEVLQDDNHFLVRIHPENRDRAKKIAGRQWDGERRAWVYPKDLNTYNALVAEFQADADTFDIRRPKTKRPAGLKPPPEELDTDESEEQLLDELRSLGDLGEKQGMIQDELVQIHQMLESISDIAIDQRRYLKEFQEYQDETTKMLRSINSQAKEKVKTEIVEVIPENLDLDKRKHLALMEQALVAIAYNTSGKNESFLKWMQSHPLLERPVEFVNTTHELIKVQLENIVGETNPGVSFYDLINQAKRENMIFSSRYDTVKIFPTLFNLNDIRNRFAHARGVFHQYEKWTRSILYLMNLALIWPKIMMEPDNGAE